ncbi:ATP-dependent RNA helicase suv3, mitochondrial [Phanerochaete sordida]|uniref:RNA helicase n=1 Tax=Phanerochaete sordida TaxID=48140 RepID=A0A9P3G4G3_9APHY|nr:ATP-dependent RNA helicase suv3, mitochondrial [Phanerochaete sordida]
MLRLFASQCRPRPSPLPTPTLVFARARTVKATSKRPGSKPNAFQGRGTPFSPFARPPPRPRHTQPLFPKVEPSNILSALSVKAAGWKEQQHVRQRLKTYGIPSLDIPIALSSFEEALRTPPFFERLNIEHERIQRLANELSGTKSEQRIDVALTSLFYEWASHPAGRDKLSGLVSPAALTSISALFQAADLADPGAAYPLARQEPRRKIIMHVGPTNSGKTYNALRALAAAESGVYAGPLRLLAHEIFERLNNGQIVPLGQDPDADAEPDEDINLDVAQNGEKPAIQKKGDRRFARACNLLTGEEQRIVDEAAGLISCTVEMTPCSLHYDVAVIDEIQMIADAERGSSWTSVLLSINAKEIHLCGEETAVPLVQRIVRDLGDEFVVNIYQRLSPLTVAEEALNGDFSKARKGDCFVAFSRSRIFEIKKAIEQATNMKCAVAYGRLPPELRTEQAALFNKPGTDYDIMVGSDAIGMGLNLKIKRVVFDTTTKWNGTERVTLSLSSLKQIAGRAGRFGMHGDTDAGGEVTTLMPEDLPVVEEALRSTPQPLTYARIHPTGEQFEHVVQTLPAGTPLSTAELVFEFVSRVHPSFELNSVVDATRAFDYIDRVSGKLTLGDRQLLRLAPIPWRDEKMIHVVTHLLRLFSNSLSVDYRQLFRLTDIQDHLDEVDLAQTSGHRPPSNALLHLEQTHKLVIIYLWLSYRNPVAFSQRQQMTVVKQKVEKLMEWCLESADHTSSRRRPKVVGAQQSSHPSAARELVDVVQKRAAARSERPQEASPVGESVVELRN